MISSENIFECDGEAVPDMKVAIGVGWRHDDRVGGLGAGGVGGAGVASRIGVIGFTSVGCVGFASCAGVIDFVDFGAESVALLPEPVDGWLEFGGFVRFAKFHKIIIACLSG